MQKISIEQLKNFEKLNNFNPWIYNTPKLSKVIQECLEYAISNYFEYNDFDEFTYKDVQEFSDFYQEIERLFEEYLSDKYLMWNEYCYEILKGLCVNSFQEVFSLGITRLLHLQMIYSSFKLLC